MIDGWFKICGFLVLQALLFFGYEYDYWGLDGWMDGGIGRRGVLFIFARAGKIHGRGRAD